jgi:hypothetical protein
MSNEFGPQTYQIKKVLEKFKTLTPAQIKSLNASRDASRNASRDASRAAAWDASRAAAWDASRAAAWDAAWDASRNASLAAAWDAALAMREAVEALHSRDLIGNKFTQANYDYLVLPWRQSVGEFEEPPTLELFEKRIEKVENYIKNGHAHIPIIQSPRVYPPLLYAQLSSNYEYTESKLEKKKKEARDKALEKLNARNAESVKEYQAEKKRIEEMK